MSLCQLCEMYPKRVHPNVTEHLNVQDAMYVRVSKSASNTECVYECVSELV